MAGYLAMGGIDIINKIKAHDFEGAADQFLSRGGTVLVEMLKKFGLAAPSKSCALILLIISIPPIARYPAIPVSKS
jgi:hypothetical protein